MKWIRRFAVAGALVALVVLSVLWIRNVLEVRRENRYSYTYLGMCSLGHALQRYLDTNGHLPGPQFADVTAALSDSTYSEYFDGTIGRTFLGGHDMYGNLLSYELKSPMEAVVKSFGENGRDDHGQEDDFVFHVSRYGLDWRWPKCPGPPNVNAP